jgi:NAD-dependent SIR2 family protein deacetylase
MHECHGSIHHLQCINDCKSGVWSVADFEPEVDDETCRLLNAPPSCPFCGCLARPNIMMFGDWNWLEQRSQSQQEREAQWLESIADNQARVVIVEMGAGTAIPSVRHFSHHVIYEYGARLIRINPREPQVPSSRDVGIATGSHEALRGIDLAIEDLAAG